jgi:Nidogen-like
MIAGRASGRAETMSRGFTHVTAKPRMRNYVAGAEADLSAMARVRERHHPRSPLAMVASCATALAVVLLLATNASAASAGAVIPTSSAPGRSANVINNYVSVPFPANDDGTWPCGPEDASAPVPCPGPQGQTGPETYPFGFGINFFGSKFEGAYINTNGNITFAEPLPQFTPTSLTEFGSPIIAPFFADVDTRGEKSAIVNFGKGTLEGKKVFVVNWPEVGCFGEISSVLDNFQLVLIDRPELGTGADGDDFEMEFNYDKIQWDTGGASGGDAECVKSPEEPEGTSAIVGYTNGTATEGDHFELPGSEVPDAFLDSSATGLVHHDLNSETPGRYVFPVVNGQPTSPTKIELPTPASPSNQVGGSISLTASVIENGAPRAGTQVTFAVTGANPQTATVTSNPAGQATFTYVGSNAGTDHIVASFLNSGGEPVVSNEVTETWTSPSSSGSSSNSGTGTTTSVASTVGSGSGGVLPSKEVVLPPPVLGKTVNAQLVSGVVFVKLPSGAQESLAGPWDAAFESLSKGLGFVPLVEARQIPVGSVLETTHGVVQLTTATAAAGKFQFGDFGAGIFKLLQNRKQRGLTELDIMDARSPRQVCATVGKRASVASRHLSSTVLGRLSSSDHGKFTARGQYSAATVRGTEYAVTNECAGTLTQVRRGEVSVRDFVRRKTITLFAGQHYLAKAP